MQSSRRGSCARSPEWYPRSSRSCSSAHFPCLCYTSAPSFHELRKVMGTSELSLQLLIDLKSLKRTYRRCRRDFRSAVLDRPPRQSRRLHKQHQHHEDKYHRVGCLGIKVFGQPLDHSERKARDDRTHDGTHAANDHD